MSDAPFITYQLCITVSHELSLTIGRLGECHFPPGEYVYTGSARRNFEARIARHLRREKRLHWHIDYLLTAPGVSIHQVRRLTTPECQVNRQTTGQILHPGFGATDCRAHCGAHLKYLDEGNAG